MGAELTLQAMRTNDYAGSRLKGQQMAGNEMSLSDQRISTEKNQTLENVRKQAVEGGYDVEKHKKLLIEQGYYNEAMDLSELESKTRAGDQSATINALNILNKTALVTTQVGAPAWPTLRSGLIKAGLANEESLPIEYDEDAKRMTTGLIGNTDKMIKVQEFRSGNKAKNIITQGGKIIQEGDEYDAKGSGRLQDSRSAFEKQVDSYTGILKAKFPEVSEKELRFMAADVFIHSKEKTDLETSRGIYETFLRANFGDEEAAQKGMNTFMEMRKKMKAESAPKPRANPRQEQKPAGSFEEGKIYQDAAGNKAKYVNGAWEPVK